MSKEQNASTERAEAIEKFHKLFDTVSVAIEEISDVMQIYDDTSDEYFTWKSHDKNDAQCILVEHPRYAKYIRTANHSLSTALRDIIEAIEAADDYYSKL